MTRGDIAFLDTNILLSVTDTGRPAYLSASSVFAILPDRGIHLALSGQIIREYLSVSTRSVDHNGLGLSVEDALYNITEFRSLTTFLDETREVTDELLRLISDSEIQGKRIHDANIVATMQSHGVGHLITLNIKDFLDLGSIEVHSPDQLN